MKLVLNAQKATFTVSFFGALILPGQKYIDIVLIQTKEIIINTDFSNIETLKRTNNNHLKNSTRDFLSNIVVFC